VLLETEKLLMFFNLHFEEASTTESCVKSEVMVTREQRGFQSCVFHLPSVTIHLICLRYRVRGS